MNSLDMYNQFRSEAVEVHNSIGNMISKMDAIMNNKSLTTAARHNSLSKILDEFNNLG